MKVLYLTNSPSPYRIEFFNKLSELCDLTVVFDKEQEKGRNNRWYQSNNYKFEYIFLGKNKFIKMIKILNIKYDLIIVGMYTTRSAIFSRFIMKWKNKKYIINADGGFIDEKDNFFTKKLKAFFISSASYWISSGQETNKYLVYYGAKQEYIYIYPFTSLNKCDLLSYQKLAYSKKKLRKKYGYTNEKIFISVGNFIERKGYDILLECIKKYKYDNIKFIIIGGGEKKEEFIVFIEKNEIHNVDIIDFIPKNQIMEYLQLSDVFLMPTREDIWGLVINEAMAAGLPIISSNRCIAALEFKLPDIYEYHDITELHKLITKYSTMTEKDIEKNRKMNLEKIKNYTIEKMTISTYESLVEINNRLKEDANEKES